MNIGIVTTWFERGAAYVSRQYAEVLEAQHNVYVYARGGEAYAIGDPNWDKPNVTWGKKCFIPLPTAIDLDDFERWVRSNQLAVVFFNEQFWWEPVLACRRMGVKTGGYVDYYTEETVPFFGCYDFLVCNTRRHQSAFDWHPQCYYIPWGTDLELFKPSSFEPVFPGTVTFFHSAGVNPHRKGCDLVIEAFARLGSKARLVIHSQQNLKSFFPRLANTISCLEKEERLSCYEKTVAAPGLFHLGDVYVYPTRLEGIGLTILEANACGLPVVVTGCPPMSEFIQHELNGRHVKVDRYVARRDGYYWPQAYASTEDLMDQMEWYADNQAKLKQSKAAARTYAEKNFRWSSNAASILDVFRDSRQLSLSETGSIVAEVTRFEARRAQTHRLSRYEKIRAYIEHHHPKAFKAISSTLSSIRNSSAEKN